MSEKSTDLAKNKRAFFDYEILETFEAGITLVGTEVKSLRENGGSLNEAYVQLKEGEAYLLNSSIAPYRHGNIYNHEERRERKLLLHKRELDKLEKSLSEKGLAVIPLALYLSKGRVKVKIAVARGKKHFDKREATKKKDMERRIRQEMKS